MEAARLQANASAALSRLDLAGGAAGPAAAGPDGGCGCDQERAKPAADAGQAETRGLEGVADLRGYIRSRVPGEEGADGTVEVELELTGGRPRTEIKGLAHFREQALACGYCGGGAATELADQRIWLGYGVVIPCWAA